nr:MAG TPA: hypothetical protein [Bacteriophage sp.]
MIVNSPQIISYVSIQSYTWDTQFTFLYRTISPSGGSQILRLFLLLDKLPHLFLISHFFETVHEHSGI